MSLDLRGFHLFDEGLSDLFLVDVLKLREEIARLKDLIRSGDYLCIKRLLLVSNRDYFVM